MRNILLLMILASFAIGICGCGTNGVNTTEEINLSEGTTIWITQDGTVIIDTEVIPVDKVMDKLEALKVKTSDVIVIKVSPRTSQRPVLKILDQLGDAKYMNITITSGK